MKTINALFLFTAAIGFVSCTSDINVQPQPSVASIPVPNGDFEMWSTQLPVAWETNSCPPCVPAYETYIVQQDTDAYQGQYAAKFIYNNVYPARAENHFSISRHPEELNAFVKCNLAANDSVHISVTLFHNNVAVDDGDWYGTTSITSYTQIQVPISQNAAQADSVSIVIEGGHINAYPFNNTELWIDAVSLD